MGYRFRFSVHLFKCLAIVALMGAAAKAKADASVYPSFIGFSNDFVTDPYLAADNNVTTAYSSKPFSSMLNERGALLGVLTDWTHGQRAVSQLLLFPKIVNGAPSGFPQIYFVLLLNSDGSGWSYAGTYSDQPTSSGFATVNLGKTYNTVGAMIIPAELGRDASTGSYVFQMADVAFASGVDVFNGIVKLPSATSFNLGASLSWWMQTNGNFVLYRYAGTLSAYALWESKTQHDCLSNRCSASVQPDGGVVLLDQGTPYWSGSVK